MELEQFIFPEVDRAQQWVDICAKSLNITRVDAAIILSHLCGFPSWDHMVQCIGREPPSACDEAIEETRKKSRKTRYIKLLTTGFALDKKSGTALIENLSPSSSKPFKVFSLDVPELKVSREKQDAERGDRQESEDGVAELMRMLDGQMEPSEVKRLLDKITRQEDEYAETIEFGKILSTLAAGDDPESAYLSNFLSSVRLRGDTHPDRWFNILSHLGWNISEETFDEEADLGEPAFIAMDDELGEVPIYLCSAVRSPYDDSDEATCLAMDLCLNDFLTGEYGGTALLIWRGPAYRKIRKKLYCHIGMMVMDEMWVEILINEGCTSPGITYDRNMVLDTINAGHPDLVDEENELFERIVLHLAGFGEPGAPEEGWFVVQSKSDTGWNHRVMMNENLEND